MEVRKTWKNWYRYVAGVTGGGIGAIAGLAIEHGVFITSASMQAETVNVTISASSCTSIWVTRCTRK